MRGSRFGIAVGAALFALILAGCGGGGGLGTGTGTTTGSTTGGTSSGGTTGGTTGSTTGGTTSTPANIFLIASAPTTSNGSTTVTLTASVTDSASVAVGGAEVTFAASAGCGCVIALSSTTTGANGAIAATLTATKPGAITISAATGTLSTSSVVTIPASPNYQLGTLSGNTFTANAIAIGQAQVSAGGSTGLQVTLYDISNNVPYSGTASVAFTSNCISSGQAQVVTPVTSATGTFNSTYTAAGCTGSDSITATATLADGSQPSAVGNVSVLAPALGSVIFDDADTSSKVIGLKGTGKNETAKVYFQVLDKNGNPVNGATINFALTTTVGGLTLSPNSATSDASGKVFTTVASGTVHTVVRVLATVPASSPALSTQSSLLTVSTGFPAQNGFSLSASKLNIEGANIDGTQTQITARLSDRYNNPVPDGTAVTFQTECGNVEPTCNTTDGACSVTFTSQNPRTNQLVAQGFASSYDWSSRLQSNPTAAKCTIGNELGCDDHRCSVLATAVGEESFIDCNGTGTYISAANASNNPSQCPQGDLFTSLSEAIQDNNENGIFDSTETYVDFNSNNAFDPASGKFVGLLCNDANCSSQTSLNVYDNIVIVMSSSAPKSPIPVSVDSTRHTVTVTVADTAGQVMPVGTIIAVTYSSSVSAVGPAAYTIANTSACPSSVAGCGVLASSLLDYVFAYSITPPATSGVASFTITSPGGLVTSFSTPVQ